MENAQMLGVDVPFVPLQIVAIHVGLATDAVPIWRCEKLVVRQLGRLASAEIGQDDAPDFATGVGRLPDTLVESRASRLARLFEATTRSIIEPAMVDAAKAAVFQPTEGQIRSAMRAVDA